MPLANLLAVLRGSGAVTALVPQKRIEAHRRTQTFVLPAILLSEAVVTPFNHLTGHAGVDANQIQLKALGTTYTQAKQVADACRTALQAAGYLLISKLEDDEPDSDPELFEFIQTWSDIS